MGAKKKKLRSIFKRAAEYAQDKQVYVLKQWLEFERVSGTIEDVLAVDAKLSESMKLHQVEEQQEKRLLKTLQAERFSSRKRKINKANKPLQQELGKRKKLIPLEEEKVAEEAAPASKAFLDLPNTLFVKNLPWRMDEEGIKALFSHVPQRINHLIS